MMVRQAMSEGLPVSASAACGRRGDLGGIMAVNRLHMPAIGAVAGLHIFGKGKLGRSVDGNFVVVVINDQAAKLEMRSQRSGFVADTFHQIAVGGDDEGAVIDQIIAKTRIHECVRPKQNRADAMPCPNGPVVISTPMSRSCSDVRASGCRAGGNS